MGKNAILQAEEANLSSTVSKTPSFIVFFKDNWAPHVLFHTYTGNTCLPQSQMHQTRWKAQDTELLGKLQWCLRPSKPASVTTAWEFPENSVPRNTMNSCDYFFGCLSRNRVENNLLLQGPSRMYTTAKPDNKIISLFISHIALSVLHV